MHANERIAILTKGRGAEVRSLVQSVTGDKSGRDLPTTSALKASIAEVYPGDEHAALRESLFGKLKQMAEARREGVSQFDLRNLADELILKIETKLADDDRLLPVVQEEEIDAGAIAHAALNQPGGDAPHNRPVVGQELVNHRAVYGQ